MRTRLILSALVGAALLTGGVAATAQAAPTSVEAGTLEIVRLGPYDSYAECKADGESTTHAWWQCVKADGAWWLEVDTDS